jgi:hypothetical protein
MTNAADPGQEEEGRKNVKKIKRPLSIDPPSFRYGVYLAAELASEYGRSSSHPYLLGDCIMAKLNLLSNKKIRKNPYARKLEQVIDSLERKVSNVESTMRFLAHSAKLAKEDKVKTFLRWAMGIHPKLWDQIPKEVRDQWKKLAK